MGTYSKETGHKKPAHLAKPYTLGSQLSAEATGGGTPESRKGDPDEHRHRDAAASFSHADE